MSVGLPFSFRDHTLENLELTPTEFESNLESHWIAIVVSWWFRFKETDILQFTIVPGERQASLVLV